VHYMAETMRRYFADRSEYMGDPEFYPVPVSKLLDRKYIEERRHSIDPQRATSSASVHPGKMTASGESDETTHYSVVDSEGNAVAVTYTLNGGYGSGVTVGKLGIVLNNEMDDFAAKPNVPNLYGLVGTDANAIAPHKTPLSSMSPTILVRDGQPVLLAGSPGGSLIITATLQTILNTVDLDMPLPQAVAQPRIHHQAIPNVILYEPGAMNDDVAADLRRRGHTLKQIPEMGNVQAVAQTPLGVKIGVSDPRGEGQPAGY